MGTTATQMPPFSQAIVDPKTGLATPNMGLWQQELLRARQAWITYTPTVAHLTGPTFDCAFQALGKLIAVRIGVSGTSDGTVATITLPFKAKSQNQTFAVTDLTAGGAGEAQIGGDLITLSVAKYDGTAPGNGTAHFWVVTGIYEAQ